MFLSSTVCARADYYHVHRGQLSPTESEKKMADTSGVRDWLSNGDPFRNPGNAALRF